jgi:hypothetical protein
MTAVRALLVCHRPLYHYKRYLSPKYQLTNPLLCLLEWRVIVEKHESKTMELTL